MKIEITISKFRTDFDTSISVKNYVFTYLFKWEPVHMDFATTFLKGTLEIWIYIMVWNLFSQDSINALKAISDKYRIKLAHFYF